MSCALAESHEAPDREARVKVNGLAVYIGRLEDESLLKGGAVVTNCQDPYSLPRRQTGRLGIR